MVELLTSNSKREASNPPPGIGGNEVAVKGIIVKLIMHCKYLRYWKYNLSFDDGEIFANIV